MGGRALGARGRISAAALELVKFGGGERPAPPDDMPTDQAETWWRIVDALPVDWFRQEAVDLLVQYCRHAARARMIAEQLNEWDRFPVSPENRVKYVELLREELAQSKAMTEIATKMRITQRSTHDSTKRKEVASTKLWEG